GADGRELLVGNRGDDDVAALVARVRGRDEHCGQRALHVVTATPVQPATVDAGLERSVHARDGHRVEVAVQEERAAAAGAPPARDDTRPLVADDLDLEAVSAAPLGNDVGRLALAGAARDEGWVDGIGLDKTGCEVDDLVHGGILATCVDSPLGGTEAARPRLRL